VIDVFAPRELRPRIIEPSGLRLMQEPNFSLTQETFETVTRWRGEGPVEKRTPPILLQAQGAPWTSICLALEKASASLPPL
jgi:hypothetical protein